MGKEPEQKLMAPFSEDYISKLDARDGQHRNYVENANLCTISLYLNNKKTEYDFLIKKQDMWGKYTIEIPPPALPLRGYGELWSTGWDISTKWAIDANGLCWADSAHGGPMYRRSTNELISEAETEVDKNMLRNLLGIKTTQACPHCHGTGWLSSHPDKGM